MQKEEIIIRIGKLIGSRKADVLQVMKKSGINVPSKASFTDISNLLVQNLGSNQKLAGGISSLLQNTSNAFGIELGSDAFGLGQLFNSVFGTEGTKQAEAMAEAAKAQAAAEAAKAQTAFSMSSLSTNKTLIIAGSVLLGLAITAFVIYKVKTR